MTTHVKVICDACGANLSAELNHPSYYLNLMSSYRNARDNESGMSVAPAVLAVDPVPTTKHFCDFDCLQRWANGEAR